MQAVDTTIQAGEAELAAILSVSSNARSIIIFAHGTGSSRLSLRNQFVARVLTDAGFGTLLLDLLTAEEEDYDRQTDLLRFNILFLAGRLEAAMDWVRANDVTKNFDIGLFGASTGAGAALVAAADRPRDVRAVVSRGGRPDMAGHALVRVAAPTLLIVGGADTAVLDLNREAAAELRSEHELVVIAGATHLFEEPGALERAAYFARDWFRKYL